jgi:hypothetical protein
MGRERWVKRAVKFLMIAPVVLVAVGFLVMSLWNSLVPAIFGGRTIGFWQAWGLILLSKIFFGGFHGRSGPGNRWRHRFMERLQEMTPEERERFLQNVGGRCRPDATSQA